MPRYVIFIKLSPQEESTPTTFDWDVRELIGEAGTGDFGERSGPSLARGKSPDVTSAKRDAETIAELLNQETVYVYNPNTQSPTP